MKQQERIHELELKIEELKTNMALMTDEIAFYTEAYNRLRKYPFEEGDTYYVLNQLDFTWIESVWDDESELLHDSTDFPDHPHKIYFTLDQKNIIDNLRKNIES